MREKKIYDRQCEICGITFHTTDSRRKYCIKCKDKRQWYRNQKQREKKRAEEPEHKTRLVNCTESIMKRCVYGGTVGTVPCCNYILVEGHSRGCSPRTCDQYKTGKKARFNSIGQVVFK